MKLSTLRSCKDHVHLRIRANISTTMCPYGVKGIDASNVSTINDAIRLSDDYRYMIRVQQQRPWRTTSGDHDYSVLVSRLNADDGVKLTSDLFPVRDWEVEDIFDLH